MFVGRHLRLVAVFAALAVTAGARADLAATSKAAFAPGCAPHSSQTTPDKCTTTFWLDEAFGSAVSWSSRALACAEPLATEGPGETTPAQTLTLPPGPGSANLFLWALGGIGIWHLGRSVLRLPLGVVPDWYHTGGPVQVGHATPLDLEFSLAALPLCPFEAPTAIGDERPTLLWLWRTSRAQEHLELFLLVAEPRGPPLHS